MSVVIRLPSLFISPRVQYSPSTLFAATVTPSTMGWRRNSSFICATVSLGSQLSAWVKPGTTIPISRFIRWLYCNKVTNSNPKTKDTPVNCTNSRERFQPFFPSVYRRNTCVTGIRENSRPGMPPATMKSTRIVSNGTHNVSHVKSEESRTESKSSIKPRVLKISKKLSNTEIMTRTPVSTRNILKILVELAPLHLCTPTPFARRLKVAMDINI